MPSVPTPGKNEQSLPGTDPRTGPGPQGGWSCSSFAPAIRKLESTGLTAIVGSFCLFVGKRAVVLLAGSPAICGLFARTSVNEIASAVSAAAARARQTASAKTSFRLMLSLPHKVDRAHARHVNPRAYKPEYAPLERAVSARLLRQSRGTRSAPRWRLRPGEGSQTASSKMSPGPNAAPVQA